jgi:hypothetical protein
MIQNSCVEIGILGFHPQTGDPLTTGVTANIPYFSSAMGGGITYGLSRNKERVMATSFKATTTTFSVVGEPWMDPTESFYLAHVETLDDRFEILPDVQHAQAEQLFAQVPDLIEEWKAWMFLTEWTTPAQLAKRHQLSEIGAAIPRTSHRDRAIWVAALLNPVGGGAQKLKTSKKSNINNDIQHTGNNNQTITFCPDIRPAMLACRNDHDRLVLAVAALKSSCDFLKRYWQEHKQDNKGK